MPDCKHLLSKVKQNTTGTFNAKTHTHDLYVCHNFTKNNWNFAAFWKKIPEWNENESKYITQQDQLVLKKLTWVIKFSFSTTLLPLPRSSSKSKRFNCYREILLNTTKSVSLPIKSKQILHYQFIKKNKLHKVTITDMLQRCCHWKRGGAGDGGPPRVTPSRAG